tara:strand:- start:196 stop:513 length:318 start_codon:yes stop_codon:yes gene_type:complete
MTLRDEFAEIINEGELLLSYQEIADAIIAALPDMIEPLVWEERRDDYWNAKGTTYQVAYNGGGKWRVRLGGRVIYRSRPSRCDAKAAANTHHRNSIMAAFKGEDK